MTLTSEDLKAISNLLDNKLDEKLGSMNSEFNGKLDLMNNEFNGKLDSMNNEFNGKLDSMNNEINDKFCSIDNELEKLNSQVSALRSGQLEIRKEIRVLDRKLSDTYQLALDAWGTSTENRQLIARKGKLKFKHN